MSHAGVINNSQQCIANTTMDEFKRTNNKMNIANTCTGRSIVLFVCTDVTTCTVTMYTDPQKNSNFKIVQNS
jgi:hypothetical protein